MIKNKLLNSYKDLIRRALKEDLDNAGDITTEALIASNKKMVCYVVARESCVVSGTRLASETFKTVDPDLKIEVVIQDGRYVKKGTKVLKITGRTSSILTAERTALNFMMLMCGIATRTREFVKAVGGKKARIKILDTRKTHPLLREISKEAVLHGGGSNHRMGLFDMYLIKDNHIVAAGGITNALDKVFKARKNPGMNKKKVEVEVDDLTGFHEALNYPVDIIMLDNFSNVKIKMALAMLDKQTAAKDPNMPPGRTGDLKSKPLIEVSGNIDLDRARSLKTLSIDLISTSKITFGARPIDLGLDMELPGG